MSNTKPQTVTIAKQRAIEELRESFDWALEDISRKLGSWDTVRSIKHLNTLVTDWRHEGELAMVTVMRPNRTTCEVEERFMLEYGAMLFFTRASDGVWVPTADLQQYEAGARLALALAEV